MTGPLHWGPQKRFFSITYILNIEFMALICAGQAPTGRTHVQHLKHSYCWSQCKWRIRNRRGMQFMGTWWLIAEAEGKPQLSHYLGSLGLVPFDTLLSHAELNFRNHPAENDLLTFQLEWCPTYAKSNRGPTSNRICGPLGVVIRNVDSLDRCTATSPR